jgi:hypothetical protein
MSSDRQQHARSTLYLTSRVASIGVIILASGVEVQITLISTRSRRVVK